MGRDTRLVARRLEDRVPVEPRRQQRGLRHGCRRLGPAPADGQPRGRRRARMVPRRHPDRVRVGPRRQRRPLRHARRRVRPGADHHRRGLRRRARVEWGTVDSPRSDLAASHHRCQGALDPRHCGTDRIGDGDLHRRRRRTWGTAHGHVVVGRRVDLDQYFEEGLGLGDARVFVHGRLPGDRDGRR